MLGEWSKQYEPNPRSYTLQMSKAILLKRLTQYSSDPPSDRT